MAATTEARAAINAAMTAIEQRISANPTPDELGKLRVAYSRLWIILGQLEEILLEDAAAHVASAALRLQQVVATPTSTPIESYLRALDSALAGIGVQASVSKPPASPATVSGSTGNSHVAGPSEGNQWQRLISYYQKYDDVSTPLKVATLAQWSLESGRGTSALAAQFNNFAGLKFRERMSGHALPVDYTGSDGETTTYCSFESVERFVSGYWFFIASGPYSGWESFRDDGAGFIRHIAPKYAADAGYIQKVLALFEYARTMLSAQALEPASDTGLDGATAPRVAVVVGHNRLSKGAPAGAPINQLEFDFNSVVAKEMKEEARHYNLNVEVFFREPHGDYSKEINKVYAEVAAFSPVCALELHFNGVADAGANGTEMLCAPNDQSQALGLKLVASTKGLLDLAVRHGNGIKLLGPGDRGWASVSALPSVASVLCEPFFGSNAADRLAAAAAGKEALGRAYLRGVRDWLEAKDLDI